MFRNYLAIALRNLRKNKTHSFINIAGLSIGMAVTLLIGLWIWDELSFDKYHQHYSRIAQVMERNNYNGTIKADRAIPIPLQAALRKSYGSDFTRMALVSWTNNFALAVDDKKISFPCNYMGEEGPELFSLRMLKGSRSSLKGTSSVLISQKVAHALFGDNDAMGKVVKFDNTALLTITGVYEDLPRNSTLYNIAYILPWDLYASTREWVRRAETNWQETSFQLFAQVADQADVKAVSQKIKQIKLDNAGAEAAKQKTEIFLHPMSKWHLFSEFKNGVAAGGAIEYVWLFGITGLFVLLLACINFMNLSTARSEKRAKEVGIRKAVGSLRVQLISQFFFESVVMAMCAFGLSLLLAWLLLPAFNEVANKQLTIVWNNPLFWIISIGVTLFTGLVAGSYPALFLSSFNPVKVLKGTFKAGRLAALPRKVLVVLQFTVSVCLIIGTIVVFNQIQFAKNRPVGYNRDGLVTIGTIGNDEHDYFDAARNDLLSSGTILEMTESSSPATGVNNTSNDVSWSGKDPSMAVNFANIRVTPEYGNTIGWQIIAGRDFSSDRVADSLAMILNEAAVQYMGLKNPVGEVVQVRNRALTVIGVVKDMVMESPYNPARQTFFYIGKGDFDNVLIRINPAVSAHTAISKIEAVCKTYNPSVPFAYSFVDETYARKFSNEQRTGRLATWFAVLAIFISCLGLFGMATFMAEQRIKEIGVRKVLGASVFNLWGLLSKDFIALVLISLCIASPVAYLFMHKWLQNYQYHSTLSWWIFAAAGAGAMLITLLTVSYQSIKAALSNPVAALRSE